MKKLLIIGDGDIGINQSDVIDFNIISVENLTLEEFYMYDNFENCIIMKGLIETSDFMRRVLEINKNFGGGFISHCGVFKRDNFSPIIITDSALNIAPTLQDKQEITKNAIALARRIGLSDFPIVNFLTPSSKIDKKIKSSLDAAELEKFVANNFQGIRTTHNALDVCFSDSAKLKKIDGALRPDILICDNIDQSNALYKSLTIFGGFITAGFIVGNENLPPIILTSRSDTKESKIWSIKMMA
ncbi:MAG: phosphate acyltransferase [Alphaproteobacteria bacterium]|jgi:phosphate butyryltransferase